jgi:hypothetical protein
MIDSLKKRTKYLIVKIKNLYYHQSVKKEILYLILAECPQHEIHIYEFENFTKIGSDELENN